MGAFSVKPFDNDEALDWIISHIIEGLRYKQDSLQEHQYNVARAASQSIIDLQKSIPFLREDVRLAMKRIGQMSKDDTWLDGWISKRDIVTSLDKQYKDLNKMLPKCYGK